MANEAEKLAAKLRGWAEELAGLEAQCGLWQAARVDALAEGRARVAGKLDGQLTKAGKRAADLRVLIDRQAAAVRAAIVRAENTWPASAYAAYAADEAEYIAAHAEHQRAEIQLGIARGRLQAAAGRLAASANFDSDARDQRNRAAWLESEFARLTGQPVPASTWAPSWLAEPTPTPEPLGELRPVATPAVQGGAWQGDAA